MRALVVILALALTHPAVAGTRDDGVPDARYLELGRQMLSYTPAVSCRSPDGHRHTATAVVVAGRWALTAAHVVAGCEDVRLEWTGRSLDVDLVVVHPGWERLAMASEDLALLRTSGDCGLSWYPEIAEEVAAGELCIVAGYGVTGTMGRGYEIADGRLRAGTQTIDSIDGPIVTCSARRKSSHLEYMIAPGDSGGPLFVGSGSYARLAAINSHQVGPRGPLRSRYGEESCHVLLSAVRVWMTSVMEAHHGTDEPSEGQAR